MSIYKALGERFTSYAVENNNNLESNIQQVQ